MTKDIQYINPVGLNDPSNYGFSHIAIAPADAKLVYIAGQFGEDENGDPISDDFATQLKQAFSNLRTTLTAVGATPEQVIKITILSVEHDAQKQKLISNERKAMWKSDRKPASMLIPVPRLALDWMLFEIDAVAIIPNH
ncbi:MAG: RidA family protein [Hydrococcus sp. Prado102]|jgi:enamine deaminase RidA (YjgF/YER057c/UK114 family)|nr:RidA family protein [Hydrococcus sp. Prado102]